MLRIQKNSSLKDALVASGAPTVQRVLAQQAALRRVQTAMAVQRFQPVWNVLVQGDIRFSDISYPEANLLQDEFVRLGHQGVTIQLSPEVH